MNIQEIERRVSAKIAEVVVSSIQKNFYDGGRPEKWIMSGRAKGYIRSKADGKKRQGKTLIDTGTLYKSIHSKYFSGVVVVGTNVEYAKIHNQGGIKTQTKVIKGFKITKQVRIPKREFMMLQDSDYKKIHKIIMEEMKNA